MSLDIDVARVRGLLLQPDGQWHEVREGSFHLDAYEFSDGDYLALGGGDCSGVPATGATWLEKDQDGQEWFVFCPLTSIGAVRTQCRCPNPEDPFPKTPGGGDRP